MGVTRGDLVTVGNNGWPPARRAWPGDGIGRHPRGVGAGKTPSKPRGGSCGNPAPPSLTASAAPPPPPSAAGLASLSRWARAPSSVPSTFPPRGVEATSPSPPPPNAPPANGAVPPMGVGGTISGYMDGVNGWNEKGDGRGKAGDKTPPNGEGKLAAPAPVPIADRPPLPMPPPPLPLPYPLLSRVAASWKPLPKWSASSGDGSAMGEGKTWPPAGEAAGRRPPLTPAALPPPPATPPPIPPVPTALLHPPPPTPR